MTPAFSLTADGADITKVIAAHLVEISVSDEAGVTSDEISITLADPQAQIEIPAKGVKLRLAIGYLGALVDQGLFVVDDVEISGPPDVMVIKAKGADFGANLKSQKTRSFSSVKLSDVVATIASEHDLKPAIGDAFTTFQIDHLAQTNESDLHLLTRLAKDYGAVAKPANGHLVFAEAGKSQATTGQKMPSINLGRNDISSYRCNFEDRGKFASVNATWTDHRRASKVKLTAGSGAPAFNLKHEYPTPQAAQAAAAAKMAALKRGTGKLSLNMPGRPDICAEATIILSGIRPGVDGRWLVTRAEHRLSASSGLTTSIQAETPE